MVTPAEKVYKPINGAEAMELVLNEFRKAMRNSGLFPMHRVFHEFEMRGGLEIKGYATGTARVQFTKVVEGEQEGEYSEERVNAVIEIAPPSLLREQLAADEVAARAEVDEQFKADRLAAIEGFKEEMLDEKTVDVDVFPCRSCQRTFDTFAGRRTHEKRFCPGLHSVTEETE